MVAELGTLRLRAGDSYVIARSDGTDYSFEVSDAVGGPVPDDERLTALRHMLEEVSALRKQLWEEINR